MWAKSACTVPTCKFTTNMFRVFPTLTRQVQRHNDLIYTLIRTCVFAHRRVCRCTHSHLNYPDTHTHTHTHTHIHWEHEAVKHHRPSMWHALRRAFSLSASVCQAVPQVVPAHTKRSHGGHASISILHYAHTDARACALELLKLLVRRIGTVCVSVCMFVCVCVTMYAFAPVFAWIDEYTH